MQRPIGQILVDRGALTQDQLRSVIATWLGEYTVHPGDITPEASALALIPRAVAEGQALAWKKRAEALSRVVNKAINNGHLGAPYAGEARRIMAGEA